MLHVIPQHPFLGPRMEAHLPVQPVPHRMPVQGMLEPVRSYVGGKAASRGLVKKAGVVYNE